MASPYIKGFCSKTQHLGVSVHSQQITQVQTSQAVTHPLLLRQSLGVTPGSQLQITGTPWRETATTRKPLLSSHCLRQPSRALRRCQEEYFSYPIQASAVELEIKRMPCATGQCAFSPVVSHADFKRWISSELNQDYF